MGDTFSSEEKAKRKFYEKMLDKSKKRWYYTSVLIDIVHIGKEVMMCFSLTLKAACLFATR